MRVHEQLTRPWHSLSYEEPGHARVVLSKVLTAASKRSRLFATSYLLLLARAGTADFADWGVRLLHTQVRGDSTSFLCMHGPKADAGRAAVSVYVCACGGACGRAWARVGI
jgi:hypothetical protein